jgi:hypothetical protein
MAGPDKSIRLTLRDMRRAGMGVPPISDKNTFL